MSQRAKIVTAIATFLLAALAVYFAVSVIRPSADVSGDTNTNAVVWGILRDSSGRPLSNILVRLGAQSSISDADGRYIIATEAVGRFPLYFDGVDSSLMYQANDNEGAVMVINGLDQELNYTLTQLPGSVLSSDTAVATPTQTPSPSSPPTATPTTNVRISTPTPTPSASPTPQPTPTPVTKNYAAIGYLDGIQNVGITTGTLFGWTFDPDAPDRSLSVEFYLDGGGGVGSYIGFATAQEGSPDVNNAFNITGRHRYSFYVPDRALNGKPIRDGHPHTIYAHGIDTDGTGLHNSLLTRPIVVTLTKPPVYCSILEILPGCRIAPTPTPKPVVATAIPTVKPSTATPKALSTSKATPAPTPKPKVCSRLARIFGCR